MIRRRPILWIALLALVLRLVPVLLTRDLPIGLDDMFQYDMLARSIVAGDGYRWYAEDDLAHIQRYIRMEKPADYDPRGIPTSFRAPGYPALLALVYAVFGIGPGRFFAVRLVQAVLGAALAPLTWALARQAGLGRRAAHGAGLVVAAFPVLIVYPLALAAENLFIPLLTLGLVLTLRAGRRRRLWEYGLAGLVLGLAALTRSIAAGFVPIAAAWSWYTAPRDGQEQQLGLFRSARLHQTAVLLLGFLLVTMPWAARNTRLHGQLTWIETSLGYNLYIGYHPQSTGTFQYGISLDLLPILDDAERHAQGMTAFWRFLRADPDRVPGLMVRKAGHLWALDSRALIYFYGNGLLGRWPAWLLGAALLLACGPLMGLTPVAAAGLFCGPLSRPKLLLAGLVVYYVGAHMLIMAEPRFHLPLLPILALWAAYVLDERPCRQSRPWQWGLTGLVITLLWVNWGLEWVRSWDTLTALFGPQGTGLRLPY